MTWATSTHDPRAPWHWIGDDAIRVGGSTVATCGYRLPVDRLRTAEAVSGRMKQCVGCTRKLARQAKPGGAP